MSDKFSKIEFFQTVSTLTTQVINDLYSKWEAMYDFTEELEERRLKKFIEYLQEFYDDITEAEEKKRVEMLDTIEKTIIECHKLQKDLHITDEEDVRWMPVREPYTKFLEEIEAYMQKYKDMKEERLAQLESLRAREKELCDLLEINPLSDFENAIPTEQQLENIEQHIFELSEEKINRIETFKEFKGKIMHLMRLMEHEPVTEFELDLITSFESSFIPSGQNMAKLKEVLASYEKEYNEKLEYRAMLIEKLRKLWERINVEPEEREEFVSKWNCIKKSHFEAIHNEIKRCEEIKLANIKPIIEKLREQMQMFWDLLTYTDEERLQFKPFTTDHFSEDVLELHELEVERLQHYYEKYQHIFDLAEKRNQLWERMLHLDEIALDKNRLFNNRGGQLLKEEKERKTLEINLPKVDKQLKTVLAEYKTEENRPFLWYGVDLLEKITHEWDERIAAKECKKIARKMENQKQIETEAKLGSRIVTKRKLGNQASNVSQAKARRCDDLGSQTIVLKAGMRTPGKLPKIQTPHNISTASIASYTHFQSELEKTATTPRSALREVGNRVVGLGHSSPTLATPVGRKGTPASAIRSAPRTIPRLVRARTRLPLDF